MARESDFALCADEAGDRLEDRGFAGAVRPEKRDNASLGNIQVNVLDRPRDSVAYGQATD
jgi:hypothetical protein